jgi:hypothetical protein
MKTASNLIFGLIIWKAFAIAKGWNVLWATEYISCLQGRYNGSGTEFATVFIYVILSG